MSVECDSQWSILFCAEEEAGWAPHKRGGDEVVC